MDILQMSAGAQNARLFDTNSFVWMPRPGRRNFVRVEDACIVYYRERTVITKKKELDLLHVVIWYQWI